MDPTERGLDSPRETPTPGSILRLAALFYGALLLAAVLWRGVFGGGSILYASEAAAADGIHPLSDGIYGVLAGVGLVLASRWWTRHSRAGAALGASLRALLGPLPLGAVALLALMSGLAEEAFFRGALQPRVGLVPASLLFGLAHFVPRRGLAVWAPAAALAGLLLGGLFDWTGNLLAPAVAHVVVNGLNLHWLTRAQAPASLPR